MVHVDTLWEVFGRIKHNYVLQASKISRGLEVATGVRHLLVPYRSLQMRGWEMRSVTTSYDHLLQAKVELVHSYSFN
jgi:hypothetical protein